MTRTVNIFPLRTQLKMSVCLCYFSALNRPDAKDTDIEMLRDVIVDSLFCVLVSLGLSLSFKNSLNNVLCFYCLMTLLIRAMYKQSNANVFAGTVPIIRCPKGNAAEMVAEVIYFFTFFN